MLREITIGQYYRAESVLHRLDPRTKILCTFAYLVSLFIYANTYVYLLAIAFLLTCIALSKVPARFIFKGMKAIVMLLLITVLFNMFLMKGEVIWTFWKLSITREGLSNAVFMGLRLILLIVGSSIMTLTTTPNNLTDGLEYIMKPLKLFKFPVHEIAMMMSIALRFIPILMDETDKIMKAQMARGADFENGNIFKRAKSLVPILVPLFISAFRRASDLAMAMEARCYRGSEGRTKMKPLKYRWRDFAAYVVVLLYLAGSILLGIYGGSLPYSNF